MGLVRELKARGIAVVYISHYLAEVFEIGDTILVLKDGEQVGIHRREEVDVDFVVRSMVGRDASMFFRRERVEIGKVRVEVRGMRWAGVVEEVSFDVRAGEIFGIGGLVGSGRSELVSLMFGAVPRDGGEVRIDGAAVAVRGPADAIRKRICLITEDRKKYAMFGPRSVLENLTVVHNELQGGWLLDRKGEKRLAQRMIDRLRIAVSGPDQEISSLSGGNQQKVVIARWLLEDADLYIFDEPTKGVDVGAKEEIYRLMVELARAGKSVVMVSSDMPELLSLSDRIGIMRGGRMVRILDNAGVDEQVLIKEFIGL
jgi:ribose transport system ATP-binding protein